MAANTGPPTFWRSPQSSRRLDPRPSDALVWHRLRSETDHELRAVLICLLTAALVAEGAAAIIGEAEGGWFWLPPWLLWEPWAKEGRKDLRVLKKGWH